LRFGVLAGDGLAKSCTPAADAGEIIVDAGPDDAQPSDGPLGAILRNGQEAELIFGQADFESAFVNAGGRSASSLASPSGMFSAGGYFWIVDSGNSRLLRLDSSLSSSATLAVGQANLTSESFGPSPSILGTSSGFAGFFLQASVGGTKLVVSDYANNRVLVWAGLPTQSGAVATLVLGQVSFTTKVAGDAANQMNGPAGVWTDGTKLAVADRDNKRVLLWDTFPNQNGQSASRELGWSTFGVGQGIEPASPPNATSLSYPIGVLFDGTRLFVSDFINHRIMVWNGWPTTNGQAASYVIGQANFTSIDDTTVNASRLGWPGPVYIADGRLYVAEQRHQRVLVFDPVPTATGASAKYVLGQPDFTTRVFAESPSRSALSFPTGVTIADGYLWVADSGFNRVLGYKLYPDAQ
jgi:hypothetical protein